MVPAQVRNCKIPAFAWDIDMNNCLVELKGFEPLTSAMRMQRSSQLSYSPLSGFGLIYCACF